MTIYEWKTVGGKNVIAEYFSKLPEWDQAEYNGAKNTIETKGHAGLLELDTRQLRGKLREIRLSQNRIMYAIADGEIVYFLHACKKQKGRAEKFEIEKAIGRAKKVELW